MDNISYEIRPLYNDSVHKILDLILPIQQLEFKVGLTLEGQPDLLDIELHYQKKGGVFWGAWFGEELIGTIALIPISEESGALRKMFVKKEFRGKGLAVAQSLLDTLTTHCGNNKISKLYLGTTDVLKAAHRFYERNGFQWIDRQSLPSHYPVMMGESIYYYRKLSDE